MSRPSRRPAPPASPATPSSIRRSLATRLREAVRVWAVPALLVVSVQTLVGQTYRIPSGSMEPTMLVGDWLVVNKLAYGAHLPFTTMSLPGYDEPSRGEIAVVVSPYQADEAAMGNDPTPTLVKRVWGTGGDTLLMRDGVLQVNGVAYPSPEATDAQTTARDYSGPEFAWQAQYAVHGSRFGEPPAAPSLDSWGPLRVPEGTLFLLGDHRHASKDSRFWGFVPRANVRGRPAFVYYSYNANDSDRAWPALTDIRWGRIGHVYR
jgi:signal peptidase I